MVDRLYLAAIIALTLPAAACVTAEDAAISADEPDPARARESVHFARDTVEPSTLRAPIEEAEVVDTSTRLRAQIAAGIDIGTPISDRGAATNAGASDGRVYNVLSTVNIRSCASTSCPVVRVANAGADLENDLYGGTVFADGYQWIRVVYAYGTTAGCDTFQYKGWVIVTPLVPGTVHVRGASAPVRQSWCSGAVITTAPAWSTLYFYYPSNQWTNKWYGVHVPENYSQLGWIDGWDLADVY